MVIFLFCVFYFVVAFPGGERENKCERFHCVIDDNERIHVSMTMLMMVAHLFYFIINCLGNLEKKTKMKFPTFKLIIIIK
jgi:hypothetical protein